MKCPECLALNSPTDPKCAYCGRPFEGPKVEPAWTYIFVFFCFLIPIVAVGGFIPIFIGCFGASACVVVGKWRLPEAVQAVLCVGITVGCWFVFGAFVMHWIDLGWIKVS